MRAEGVIKCRWPARPDPFALVAAELAHQATGAPAAPEPRAPRREVHGGRLLRRPGTAAGAATDSAPRCPAGRPPGKKIPAANGGKSAWMLRRCCAGVAPGKRGMVQDCLLPGHIVEAASCRFTWKRHPAALRGSGILPLYQERGKMPRLPWYPRLNHAENGLPRARKETPVSLCLTGASAPGEQGFEP